MLCFKRENHRVYFLKLNEDPVREMTICHAPQREEKYPGTCGYLETLNQWPNTSRGSILHFFFLF